MTIKALQDYTFTAKYANYLPVKKRRETWVEAVDRVKNMMLFKYSKYDVTEEIEWAYDLVRQKKVLGSQRTMQFGGEPALKHEMRNFNCQYSHIDRLSFFQECMYLLLCGGGVGYSVQKHHIARIPNLLDTQSFKQEKTFKPEDSIEGWADCIGVLVSSYFEQSELFPEYTGKRIDFDLTNIRPEGASIRGITGKAPGPKPLSKALSKIKTKLDMCLQNGIFRPVDAHDIVCIASDAVLAGGVRRSALLSLFSIDDEDMKLSKTGNWFYENPQRARANNSVRLIRGEFDKKQYNEFFSYTKEYGEPGLSIADSAETGANPCHEILHFPYLVIDEVKYQKAVEEGKIKFGFSCQPEEVGLKTGFQPCNLTTINCKKTKTEEEFLESCKAASFIGTLQAGLNSAPYMGKVTEQIIKNEALLGVSMTGVMDNPELILQPSLLKKGAKVVIESNSYLAPKININKCARACTIKPEGTTSCILGTSSGMHPHHYKRYIRRVQANRNENVFKHFYESNPVASEKSVWSANDTDYVIAFACETSSNARSKNEMSAIDLLEVVKTLQVNWVNEGVNKDLCVLKNTSHTVSNTINVKPDEWDIVSEYIFKNQKYLAGISLLSNSGDKDYPQAPFTAVYLPSQIAQEYGNGSILASGLIERGLVAFNNNLWLACDAVMGIGFNYDDVVEKLSNYSSSIKSEITEKHDMDTLLKQLYFVDSIKKFANKYMGGDIKKTTYLLKDVYNWKTWSDLQREYKEVDYSLMIEHEDNTNLQNELGCSGGKCEIL
jgi:ribonucleoside-triphosphate reductase (thioredoxin)